jgi:hypothetical protein
MELSHPRKGGKLMTKGKVKNTDVLPVMEATSILEREGLVFFAKKGSGFSNKMAQKCGEELQLLYSKHGDINRMLIVDELEADLKRKNKQFPFLRKAIDRKWNDKEAARKYRLDQTSRVLSLIMIPRIYLEVQECTVDMVRNDKRRVPLLINAHTEVSGIVDKFMNGGDSYMGIDIAMDDETIRERQIIRFARGISAMCEGKDILEEIAPEIKKIKKIAESILAIYDERFQNKNKAS